MTDMKDYGLTEEDQTILDKWRHFRPQGDQQDRYILINRETRRTAKIFMERCPKSAERTLALRKLEEARLWATNAIMRNEDHG